MTNFIIEDNQIMDDSDNDIIAEIKNSYSDNQIKEIEKLINGFYLIGIREGKYLKLQEIKEILEIK